jgi:DNA-binding transcriptional LysR family regulator
VENVVDLDLNQLRSFHAVARRHSYTGAARELHVTQSAVSHAMRKLEEAVGRPLVRRRGRGFELTADGRYLAEVCERVFGEIERARLNLADAAPGAQRMVLGATVEFGTTVLVGRLAPFIEMHPEIHLDLHFSHHLVEPLLRDEVDICVDCNPHPHPSVVATDLFRETYSVIASPGFIRRHALRTPSDLADLRVLSLDDQGEWWARVLRALPEAERPVLRRLVAVNHVRGIINAALAGLGVGLVPTYTVLAELGDGRLCSLFPDLPLREDRFRILRKRSRQGWAPLEALTLFLLAMDPGDFGDAIGRAG